MSREQILEILTRSKPTLQAQFGVKSMALFGSIVRDEAQEDSDVDILVEFADSATSKQYFGVRFHLEDLLGRPVDLSSLKKRCGLSYVPTLSKRKSMSEPRAWHFYIGDMINFANTVGVLCQ